VEYSEELTEFPNPAGNVLNFIVVSLPTSCLFVSGSAVVVKEV